MANTKINKLFELIDKYGSSQYHGEAISQLEHMSQCGQLAIDAGCSDEVILASFLHDIGHIIEEDQAEMMDDFGKKSHELIGAIYLENLGFSNRIIEIIKSHVKAKRYLTFKFPEYYASLSFASKKTLEFQGGIMDESEAKAFEIEKDFEVYIQVRKFDDMAKEVDIPVNNLDTLKMLCTKHLNSAQLV